MAKGTDIEVEARINTVYEMLLKAASRPFIIRYASEKWGITDRQTDEYIKRANVLIESESEHAREKMLSKCIARLEDLYRKNYTVEDFRECRNLIGDMRKLLGLDEAKKVQIEMSSLNILNIDPLDDSTDNGTPKNS